MTEQILKPLTAEQFYIKQHRFSVQGLPREQHSPLCCHCRGDLSLSAKETVKFAQQYANYLSAFLSAAPRED